MQPVFLISVLAAVVGANPAVAWWGDGHGILTRAALRSLPEEMPEFFRSGEEVVAHVVYDPDLAKNRLLPALSDREHPEHFLDIELLKGRQLPLTRYEYSELCSEVGTSAKKAGLVVYAVAEWTELLTLALAEYRRWPEVDAIKSKCLVYAGHLAHYAQDLCQPLHLTIHFDGRVSADGTSPHSGIHEKVDSIIERSGLTPEQLSAAGAPRAAADLMPAIMSEFESSYALVGRVYELESELESGLDKPGSNARRFALERANAAARFTAELYLMAWQRSEEVRLPGWLGR